MKKVCKNLNGLEKVAEKLYEVFESKKNNKKAVIVALKGDLGSGKTTFTKSLAKVAGIKETVTSPTFVIEKIYQFNKSSKDRPCYQKQGPSSLPTSSLPMPLLPKTHNKFKKLIHIDAYRLESGRDLQILGWDEIVNNPDNLVLIEWPEMVSDILDKNVFYVNFEFVDKNTRKVKFFSK